MFWTPKNSIKGKCYVFSGYEQKNQVCLVYLGCKLDQHNYDWCIFKQKFEKNGGNKIFRDKQTTKKVLLMFFDFKMLTER